jgi:hypothetical protein
VEGAAAGSGIRVAEKQRTSFTRFDLDPQIPEIRITTLLRRIQIHDQGPDALAAAADDLFKIVRTGLEIIVMRFVLITGQITLNLQCLALLQGQFSNAAARCCTFWTKMFDDGSVALMLVRMPRSTSVAASLPDITTEARNPSAKHTEHHIPDPIRNHPATQYAAQSAQKRHGHAGLIMEYWRHAGGYQSPDRQCRHPVVYGKFPADCHPDSTLPL